MVGRMVLALAAAAVLMVLASGTPAGFPFAPILADENDKE